MSDAAVASNWRASGSYFEVCNCDAICPCRRQGGQKLTTGSTYGICQFALSWFIKSGNAGAIDLTGRAVVLAGFYRDDEAGKPWRVALYVDDGASSAQHDALASIFLGRWGGTPSRNFAKAIADVYAIRRAAIDLDHHPGRWFIAASDYVTVRSSEAVPSALPVSCGIPGHDQPGNEVVAEVMHVADDALQWDIHGKCGFASTFDYAAD